MVGAPGVPGMPTVYPEGLIGSPKAQFETFVMETEPNYMRIEGEYDIALPFEHGGSRFH